MFVGLLSGSAVDSICFGLLCGLAVCLVCSDRLFGLLCGSADGLEFGVLVDEGEDEDEAVHLPSHNAILIKYFASSREIYLVPIC